ncbi:MAG: PEP-CTERM sorting domain-containing protein [Gemmatimonadaceae bacterium]|nr:PEP-CTERM sorting domain-containing protein [Gemmatimonadaceae bacterium]
MPAIRTTRLHRLALQGLAAAAFLAAPLGSAGAQAFIDPTGDFLPSYTGPQNGDMDVVSAQVLFDGSNFTFMHTSAGAIGQTTNSIFVWGMNRGAGTARFPTLAPGVLFDWVLTVTSNGAGGFTVATRDLVSATSTSIDGSALTISGSSMSVIIPGILLPSRGLAIGDFTANLWPRLTGGALSGISDFAPDNSNFAVTVTPEPASYLLVGTGLAALLVVRRRRRHG